ncbi:WD40-repeat-containing domain protein [Scenedesmus sp. NREL 46B-D3]|nr:WD40-repeat-containing domain protein [Scenedesmus sp. NREL 46B-D3]
MRAHRLSPTALALSADEATAFTVSKDGSILKWDVETMQRTQLAARAAAAAAAGTAADWVQKGPRMNPTSSLLAAAVSSDGKFLAVGGGDKMVHVFEAGSGAHVQSYPGHRDQVSGLAFRDGTHTLYSSGFDRTVKMWSLDDGAYVDTLFGHQAEVFALDAARAERVVSVGHDHTCRLWKIPEESHLVFRSPSMAQYAVSYVTGNEWVSGGADGSLQVWNTLKKKPQSVYRGAHVSRGSSSSSSEPAADADAAAAAALPSTGSWSTAGVDTPGWIQSIAACKGSEVVASGAGDGFIRLWALQPSRHGGAGALKPVGALPAAGFVNGLALGRSGMLCVAALGQEPRLGRWGRVGNARNGLLVHRWELSDEAGSDE